MEPEKKISFAFNKISKKSALIFNKLTEEKKVDLVECLEGQSIKVKDVVEVVKEPLVIPIKDNKKNLLDRIKEARSKDRKEINKEESEDTRPDSELTLDELAARELLNDAKNHQLKTESNNKVFVLPLKEDKLVLEGEKESTLNDYETVPISDYGLAMLRGMGWKEGVGIGKNPTRTTVTNAPELRPKGLGLGANKMVKAEMRKETVFDNEGNPLILKKGAFAKIIAGSHKGEYCEVQGLDDESGRVIVRTGLKGEVLTINEFLLVPVTKEEYSRGSKILNNAKYEEFKEKADKKSENSKGNSEFVKTESNNSVSNKNDKKYESSSKSNSKHHDRKDHETSEKYIRDTKYKHEPKKVDHNTDSSDENEKTSRVHKRKDKRRHRDRSRSPRKHKYRNSKKSSKSRYRSSSSSDSDYEERKRDRKRHSKERNRKHKR